jgi:hypothetical protein
VRAAVVRIYNHVTIVVGAQNIHIRLDVTVSDFVAEDCAVLCHRRGVEKSRPVLWKLFGH